MIQTMPVGRWTKTESEEKNGQLSEQGEQFSNRALRAVALHWRSRP